MQIRTDGLIIVSQSIKTTGMKQLIATIASLALASCQSIWSDDPSSISFKIPRGSTLSLEKSIEIPEGRTLAVFQYGELIPSRKRDIYDLYCNFEVIKPGLRTISPEVFTVRRTDDWTEQLSRTTLCHFTVVHLESAKGTDINRLTCREIVRSSDYHFTATEIEQTLGDYFTFAFATD